MNIASKLAAVFCFVALAACAGGDDSAADTSAADTAPVDARGGPSAPSAPPVATALDTSLVHVPLNEWSLTVSKSVLPAGRTTFHAMNQGTYTHAFEIEGNGQEWKSDPIPPGGTAALTPTLSAGTYEVYCPVVDSHGNHQQRGMKTTFTVR